MRRDEERSLADVLKLIIQKNKLEKGLIEAEVVRLWPEVMGSGVAHYTQKVQLKERVLQVHLRSSVLREELMYGRKKIIAMLNEALNGDYIDSIQLLWVRTARDQRNETLTQFLRSHHYLIREWRFHLLR